MKKKAVIGGVVTFICVFIFAGGFYFSQMQSKSSDETIHIFTLSSGVSKLTLADQLQEQGLIKSSLALKAYLFFHSNMNLQAGTYELKASMTPTEILQKFQRGEIKNSNVKITLYEGRRLDEYVQTIANAFQMNESEILNKLSNQTFLQSLIEKYWFLTDEILNPELYYPLEGYLFPDTYEFTEHSDLESIITGILNHTETKLTELKEQIETSGYTVHEILSMASIVELEAVSDIDRQKVSQVIYKRINQNMGLGMDVTTYYAVRKKMGEGLTLSDLKTNSAYNTSEMNASMAGKLPIGPICNPSKMSIQAVLNPSDTNYLYFFADVKTGQVYFTETYEEHVQVQKEIG